MGLSINNYSASYSQLHRLRQFALDVEFGKGKKDIHKFYEQDKQSKRFNEFINHSDCDGGYISLNNTGLSITDRSKFKKGLELGDLDKLKEEMQDLKTHLNELEEGFDKESLEAFIEDVEQENIYLRYT